jgi:G patch domain-containing protein 1
VYIPKRHRPKHRTTTASTSQQERLHGAFRGGFSAGYFDTVGSAEGWKPIQEEEEVKEEVDRVDENGEQVSHRKQRRRQQRPEDFMDELDHNEWGGPTQVHALYDRTQVQQQQQQQQQQKSTISSLQDIFDDVPSNQKDVNNIMIHKPMNVGERLLRKLGWRPPRPLEDTDHTATNTTTTTILTAYTPVGVIDAPKKMNDTNNNDKINSDSTAIAILSEKRIRKIQKRQRIVIIPSPWRGTAGLGYQTLRDQTWTHAAAPSSSSFQKEQQQKRKVYRVAHVLPKTSTTIHDDDPKKHSANSGTTTSVIPLNRFRETKPPISTFQHEKKQRMDDRTTQSIDTTSRMMTMRPKKSVAGFSLADDDDDDHYDDDGDDAGAATIDFEFHAYEHDSDTGEKDGSHHDDDDVDYQHTTTTSTLTALHNVLSSWAKDTSTNLEDSSSGVLVPGFVRGCSTSIPPRRFPGPDVPLEWDVTPHQFGPHEHPRILSALSHAHQIEYLQQQQQKQQQEQEAASARLQTFTPRIFTKVRQSIKDRFTSASSSDAANVEREETTPLDELQTPSNPPKSFAFRRTILSFIPEPLLCKRFHVSSTQVVTATTAADLRTRDEAYFQDEILSQATKFSTTGDAKSSTKNEAQKLLEELSSSEIPSTMTDVSSSLPKRPPMSIYKSIFEPNVGDENDDESDKDDGSPPSASGEAPASAGGQRNESEESGSKHFSGNPKSVEELHSREMAANDSVSNKRNLDDDTLDMTDSHHQDKERESKHKLHHKKHKKRKYSSSDEESEDIKRRKKERRKEKKKKKHKHDKRRRQHDDND